MTSATAARVSGTAQKLHDESIVVDTCTQFCAGYSDHVKAAGVSGLVSTFQCPDYETGAVVERLADCYAVIRRDEKLRLVERAEDLVTAKEQGEVGIVLALQDPKPMAVSLEMVEVLYRLGLRVCTMSYSGRSFAADGCGEDANAGLSRDGRALVREMNAVGMTIDLAHVGERSSLETLSLSTRPVICTHGNPRNRAPISRNLTDEVMVGIAESGGVVCTTPYGPCNWDHTSRQPNIEDYLDNVEYVIALVGIDHVGIGTDEEATPGSFNLEWSARVRRRAYWAGAYDGYHEVLGVTGQRSLLGFRGMNDLPLITDGLLKRGYTPTDIKKFLGENIIRAFEKSWRTEIT